MSTTRNATEPLDLNVLIAETKNEPYRFNLDGERELPHLKNLKLAQVEALDAGQFAVVLPDLVDGDLAAKILDLPGFALEALIEGWLAHGGVNVGELRASLRS